MGEDRNLQNGCLSAPLFNQRKRNRLPLTSNPSESDLFSDNHYNEIQTFSLSSSGPPGQSDLWNQRPYLSSQQAKIRPAASPVVEGQGYAPLPHPKKPAYAWSQTVQQRPPVRRDSMATTGSYVHGGFPSSSSTSLGQTRWSSGFQNQNRQSFNRPTSSFRMPYCPQQCSPAAVSTSSPGDQSRSTKWNFRSTRQSDSGMRAKQNTSSERITTQQLKPPHETSMHVLTTVIEGMKHWNQYKNRLPIIFEVFATLDSAVTVGEHGAKTFSMRDGKHVVQCLYSESVQTLSRLIRGQVHCCIGNFDRDKDTMMCVSVRAASLSEQRNAQEAVKASDVEMRNVVLMFTEI
ncbi:spermatogenesis-associated protein 22-like [Myxocyprinus asiaticus]|uniref:spermatogenesis-associated protein 22-like n=1 Tax=Myxocyprinus asiaticus TaxID=70543 RepID=UPI002222FA1F|nr:spermatogenesis-associated protein 22-like [Myxocyprinus asiaticus]